jgi:hypothetical protein
MFGELPKIFDRNFLIGYFLPAVAFLAASLSLAHGVDLFKVSKEEPARFGIIMILLPTIMGAILLALNRSIFQLLEGYGRFNPFHLLGAIQLIQYERMSTRWRRARLALERRTAQAGRDLEKWRAEYQDTSLKLAERFPADRGSILPTAFGNVISSFEDYPRLLYGFDAVEGWPRLLAVIPQDFRELLNSAKAETDFWVNLWLASLLFVVDYVASRIDTGFHQISTNAGELLHDHRNYLVLLSIGTAWIAAWRGKKSAIEWGALVKSSFDLFITDLSNKLGFAPQGNLADQYEDWQSFSQAVIYRQRDWMPWRSGRVR